MSVVLSLRFMTHCKAEDTDRRLCIYDQQMFVVKNSLLYIAMEFSAKCFTAYFRHVCNQPD